MEDKELLKGLRENSKDSLETTIYQYAAYVSAVISNQLGDAYSHTDVEEIASTVFFTLWQKRHLIVTSHLRGWLGAVARNCTRSHLRKQKQSVKTVRIEDVVLVDNDKTELIWEAKERARILRMALHELGEPDCEILMRYYYHNQSTASIAQHLNMNPEAVKSRLRRGRGKLKEILQREGY